MNRRSFLQSLATAATALACPWKLLASPAADATPLAQPRAQAATVPCCGEPDSITITITGLTYDGNSGDFWQTGREYTYKCGKLAGVGPEWRSKFA
jgi:hypothetical protein